MDSSCSSSCTVAHRWSSVICSGAESCGRSGISRPLGGVPVLGRPQQKRSGLVALVATRWSHSQPVIDIGVAAIGEADLPAVQLVKEINSSADVAPNDVGLLDSQVRYRRWTGSCEVP